MTAIEPTDSGLPERIIALTRDLVLIPGTHRRPDDLDRCSRFVQNHLETVPGITVQRYTSAGIPSLVAVRSGITRPDVLLCAHLDVIDHSDAGVYRSRIEQGRIFPLSHVIPLIAAGHKNRVGTSDPL